MSAKPVTDSANIGLLKHLKEVKGKEAVKAAKGETAEKVIEDGKFFAYVDNDTVIISDKAKKGTDAKQIDLNDGGLDAQEREALGLTSENELYEAAARGQKLGQEVKDGEEIEGGDVLDLNELDELGALVRKFADTFGYSVDEAWDMYLNNKLGRADLDAAAETSKSYQEQYDSYETEDKTYEKFLKEEKGVKDGNPVLKDLDPNATKKTGTKHVMRSAYENGQKDFTEPAINAYLIGQNPAEEIAEEPETPGSEETADEKAPEGTKEPTVVKVKPQTVDNSAKWNAWAGMIRVVIGGNIENGQGVWDYLENKGYSREQLKEIDPNFKNDKGLTKAQVRTLIAAHITDQEQLTEVMEYLMSYAGEDECLSWSEASQASQDKLAAQKQAKLDKQYRNEKLPKDSYWKGSAKKALKLVKKGVILELGPYTIKKEAGKINIYLDGEKWATNAGLEELQIAIYNVKGEDTNDSSVIYDDLVASAKAKPKKGEVVSLNPAPAAAPEVEDPEEDMEVAKASVEEGPKDQEPAEEKSKTAAKPKKDYSGAALYGPPPSDQKPAPVPPPPAVGVTVAPKTDEEPQEPEVAYNFKDDAFTGGLIGPNGEPTVTKKKGKTNTLIKDRSVKGSVGVEAAANSSKTEKSEQEIVPVVANNVEKTQPKTASESPVDAPPKAEPVLGSTKPAKTDEPDKEKPEPVVAKQTKKKKPAAKAKTKPAPAPKPAPQPPAPPVVAATGTTEPATQPSGTKVEKAAAVTVEKPKMTESELDAARLKLAKEYLILLGKNGDIKLKGTDLVVEEKDVQDLSANELKEFVTTLIEGTSPTSFANYQKTMLVNLCDESLEPGSKEAGYSRGMDHYQAFYLEYVGDNLIKYYGANSKLRHNLDDLSRKLHDTYDPKERQAIVYKMGQLVLKEQQDIIEKEAGFAKELENVGYADLSAMYMEKVNAAKAVDTAGTTQSPDEQLEMIADLQSKINDIQDQKALTAQIANARIYAKRAKKMKLPGLEKKLLKLAEDTKKDPAKLDELAKLNEKAVQAFGLHKRLSVLQKYAGKNPLAKKAMKALNSGNIEAAQKVISELEEKVSDSSSYYGPHDGVKDKLKFNPGMVTLSTTYVAVEVKDGKMTYLDAWPANKDSFKAEVHAGGSSPVVELTLEEATNIIKNKVQGMAAPEDTKGYIIISIRI